jgi:hypothetical protein
VLMGELPQRESRAHGLLNAALATAALVGGALGIGFALIAPLVSSGFDPLRESPLSVLIFAVGVALTALTLVLDQALIGLLRGGLQLTRNIVFSVVKLLLLLGVAALAATYGGMGIYTAWAMGALLSLVVLIPFYRRQSNPLTSHFRDLHALRLDAASHQKAAPRNEVEPRATTIEVALLRIVRWLSAAARSRPYRPPTGPGSRLTCARCPSCRRSRSGRCHRSCRSPGPG